MTPLPASARSTAAAPAGVRATSPPPSRRATSMATAWRSTSSAGAPTSTCATRSSTTPPHGFALMHSGGTGWGSGNYTTSVATGDLDGDGLDEVIIGRNSDVNMRYEILDDANARLRPAPQRRLTAGARATSPPPSRPATSMATASTRSSSAGGPTSTCVTRSSTTPGPASPGSTAAAHGWGSGNFTTSVATGDVDGDGLEEVVIGRKSDVNMRYEILDDARAGFAQIHSGGSGWGSGNYTTVRRDGRRRRRRSRRSRHRPAVERQHALRDPRRRRRRLRPDPQRRVGLGLGQLHPRGRRGRSGQRRHRRGRHRPGVERQHALRDPRRCRRRLRPDPQRRIRLGLGQLHDRRRRRSRAGTVSTCISATRTPARSPPSMAKTWRRPGGTWTAATVSKCRPR